MLTPHQIAEAISSRFGERVLANLAADKHPRVHLEAPAWLEVAGFLLTERSIKLDWLQCLSAVDYAADAKMCVVYDLWSFDHRHGFAVKVFTPRANPTLPSVAHLWPAADWHEREAFDLVGIRFDGHPDLRRILCADDWEGHPLRKDYVFPRSYHGIPGSVELDWQQQKS